MAKGMMSCTASGAYSAFEEGMLPWSAMAFGDPIPCKYCGAMMTPQRDGRTYKCRFCNTEVVAAIEAQQIAQGMQLDQAKLGDFLDHVARTVSRGFPDRTRVAAPTGRVETLEINLDKDVFVARRNGASIVSEHKRVVRGVALKTTAHPLDKWVELLTKSLAAHANTNANAAWVLSQLHSPNGRGREPNDD
jgi:hypothetical protein